MAALYEFRFPVNATVWNPGLRRHEPMESQLDHAATYSGIKVDERIRRDGMRIMQVRCTSSTSEVMLILACGDALRHGKKLR